MPYEVGVLGEVEPMCARICGAARSVRGANGSCLNSGCPRYYAAEKCSHCWGFACDSGLPIRDAEGFAAR